MKRTICLSILAVLTCVFVFSAAAFAEAGLSNFTKVNTYEAGHFADVPEDQWYAKNVETAYELGLFVGDGNSFNPNGSISLAETLAVASRLHNTYFGNGEAFEEGSPWYQVYVDYAVRNSLIGEEDHADYKAKATRAQFSSILAKAVDDSVFTALNTVDDGAVPDVPMTAPWAEDVYKLYRAGILVGNDDKGTFTPDSSIKRSAVAAIVTRIVDESLRETITLRDPALWEDGYKKPFKDQETVLEDDGSGVRTEGIKSSLIMTDDKYCYWKLVEWNASSGLLHFIRTDKDPESGLSWELIDIDLYGEEHKDEWTEEDWVPLSKGPDGKTLAPEDISGSWTGRNSGGRRVNWYIKPDSGVFVYEWQEGGISQVIYEKMAFNGVSLIMFDFYYESDWSEFGDVDWKGLDKYRTVVTDTFVIESADDESIEYYRYNGPDYRSQEPDTRYRDPESLLAVYVDNVFDNYRDIFERIISKEAGIEEKIGEPVGFMGYILIGDAYYPLFSVEHPVYSEGEYQGKYIIYAYNIGESVYYWMNMVQ